MTVDLENFATSFPLPFPHWIADEAFDSTLLRDARGEFPDPSDPVWHTFADGQHEVGKQQLDDPSVLGLLPNVTLVLDQLRSPTFLDWAGDMLGIPGPRLIPDVVGGGLHQTTRGGFLNMHVDSSSDFSELGLCRRANVLLYLNEHWSTGMCGELRLAGGVGEVEFGWSIPPRMNRLVVFPTNDVTWHGHPSPWLSDTPRRSLAVYLYTRERPDDDPDWSDRRTTFRGAL